MIVTKLTDFLIAFKIKLIRDYIYFENDKILLNRQNAQGVQKIPTRTRGKL
jgi:hypothetical protein